MGYRVSGVAWFSGGLREVHLTAMEIGEWALHQHIFILIILQQLVPQWMLHGWLHAQNTVPAITHHCIIP